MSNEGFTEYKGTVTLIGLLFVMFLQNWKLALISIVLIPFASISARTLGKRINKVSSGRPHIVDVLNSKKISLVINTGGGNSEHRISDARALRRGTLANKIPYCTNMSTAYSFLEAIKSLKTKKFKVKSLQDN